MINDYFAVLDSASSSSSGSLNGQPSDLGDYEQCLQISNGQYVTITIFFNSNSWDSNDDFRILSKFPMLNLIWSNLWTLCPKIMQQATYPNDDRTSLEMYASNS